MIVVVTGLPLLLLIVVVFVLQFVVLAACPLPLLSNCRVLLLHGPALQAALPAALFKPCLLRTCNSVPSTAASAAVVVLVAVAVDASTMAVVLVLVYEEEEEEKE